MMDVLGDPRLPPLLSHTAHEFRTPLSVILGYLRMVLKDPSNSLHSRHRKMLEDVEKSVGRLSQLVTEMSELSQLEKGQITLQQAPVSVRAVLNDAVAALPEVPDGRTADVTIETGREPIMIRGDATWLKRAFTSILFALRREVVESDQLVIREHVGTLKGERVVWIRLAEPQHIDEPGSLGTFNEWRGGCGLSLVTARTIINAHGGAIFAPSDQLTKDPDSDDWKTESVRAAASIAFPLS
jgi:light-regulated signal transduction histidine kinase (bacteriophytochrome)